jgi:two-component system phosphate regulon response regulator PhoB
MRKCFLTSAAVWYADYAMNGPVLIIEDDPDIAEVLAYGLEKEQFVTRIALTGEEGLVASLDRSNPPAIILLDLLLPAMSGTELCRRLRQEPTTVLTPIIVITAKAFELDGPTYLQLGANDYVVKPFSIGDVVRRVRSFMA